MQSAHDKAVPLGRRLQVSLSSSRMLNRHPWPLENRFCSMRCSIRGTLKVSGRQKNQEYLHYISSALLIKAAAAAVVFMFLMLLMQAKFSTE